MTPSPAARGKPWRGIRVPVNLARGYERCPREAKQDGKCRSESLPARTAASGVPGMECSACTGTPLAVACHLDETASLNTRLPPGLTCV
ncbi:hypothetical protein NDU88_005999 [Pleurodeles waltl]|uniref:Uncharacterized protein n=1 Tax=Pleurodeles waltl TaxID=8319 RepID=A0AAV7QGG5_PLEWA|nr:hypothetical protein NDU88_005999 [Pleurodeles waltl]